MMHMCPISQKPGVGGVCGLLGAEEIAGSSAERLVVALREIVEHFRVEWEMTPHHSTDFTESAETGFVIELKGTHKPGAHHSERTCLHCANLMLGLKIIGDWVLPANGKCSFCEALAYSNFVRGDQRGQREASTTRTLRLASQAGSRCQVEACHTWCMTKMKERLEKIGVGEQEKKQLSVERAQS